MNRLNHFLWRWILILLFIFQLIQLFESKYFDDIDNGDEQNKKVRNKGTQKITIGAILPKSSLITLKRQYYKRLQDSVEILMKGKNRQEKYNFTNYYQLAQAQVVYLPLNPNPKEILINICDELLVHDVSTILYMTNSEIWGTNAASAQYLLQLTNYLGMPVIAWNADNIGLDQQSANSRLLQLAPSMEHQASAILSILRRYSWHGFSIITSKIGGYGHFLRALREKIMTISDFSFTILDILTVNKYYRDELVDELRPLSQSEARVIILYSTKREAQEILAAAADLGMTGKNYMWIVTQSVLGRATGIAPGEFPSGMLGIHFNTTHEKLLEELERAVTVFGYGLEMLVNDNKVLDLKSNVNCNSSENLKWNVGEMLFSYLRNVSIRSKYGRLNTEFNLDGTLKFVELDILNLNNEAIWERIGTWTDEGIEIKDITWPGNSPVPPLGLPEKFSLQVSWLEEPPFINFVPPDNETGDNCKINRAVPCKYSTNPDNSTVSGCCAGFCIDLLQKFSNDLKFTYELNRVEDGAWGILNNGTWNGLIADLIDHRADIVVTSIKINSDRQAFVDFTVPFLETGIAIAVAKRTGIISPKAFLEPFDVFSWVMILLISIQIAAFAIFLFEWLSPSGYDMGMTPPKDHKFSLFRTYWLVWAILFGAAVHVDCPKGYTARFMANTWATFAVVFLAIYTANLAAFMITREEYHDFTGIEDKKLADPFLSDPPLKFGTIPHGNTEAVLKRNKPKMYKYMVPFNRSTSKNGVNAVKKGQLDAFIYDAVVLDHLVGEDNDCGLLTVGSWYAMTGYGFAMAKNSKYLDKFNKKMIEYRENGDLERLRRYWFQGACKMQKNTRNISKPLDVNQFMSAFLLLGCGILLTVVLLGLEHIYFRYCRQCLARTEKDACFTLISLSMAQSLRFDQEGYTRESNICDNSECEMRRRRTLKELHAAKYKIRELESYNRGAFENEVYNDKDSIAAKIKQSKNELTFNDHSDVCTNDFETIL